MESNSDFDNFYRYFSRMMSRHLIENGSGAMPLEPPPPPVPAPEDTNPLKISTDGPKITELLKCPVCSNIPIPPISLCPEGHRICSHCRKKMDTCPECWKPFTGMRDRFAEKLLELCMVPCKNRGCRVKKPGTQMDDLSEHYYTCEFEPLVCPCCLEEVVYSDFIRHLQTDCSWKLNLKPPVIAMSPSSQVECIFNAWRWRKSRLWDKPIRIFAHNRHFFCFCKKFNEEWSIWLCLLGPKKECQEFRCKISIVNKIDQGQGDVVFSGKVHPLRDCLADEVRGLIFPHEDLHKCYVQEDGDLRVTVKIDKRTRKIRKNLKK